MQALEIFISTRNDYYMGGVREWTCLHCCFSEGLNCSANESMSTIVRQLFFGMYSVFGQHFEDFSLKEEQKLL